MTHDCIICGRGMEKSQAFDDWWLCRFCHVSVAFIEFPTATEVEYKRHFENIKNVPHGCLLILKDTCVGHSDDIRCPRCGSNTLLKWLVSDSGYKDIPSHSCENCHFRWYNDRDGILYVRYRWWSEGVGWWSIKGWRELYGVLLVFDESEVCNAE